MSGADVSLSHTHIVGDVGDDEFVLMSSSRKLSVLAGKVLSMKVSCPSSSQLYWTHQLG